MNFSIEFDEVKNAVSKLQESADKMQNFRARLHEAALECVILSGGYQSVVSALADESYRAEDYCSLIENHAEILDMAVLKYQRTEDEIKNQGRNFTLFGIGGDENQNVSESNSLDEMDLDLEKSKFLANGLDKGEGLKEAGIVKDLLDYFDSVRKLEKGDKDEWTMAANIGGLYSDGLKTYKDIYKLLNVKGQEKSVLVDQLGLRTDEIKYLKSICSAISHINKNDYGIAGKASEYIGVVDSVVDYGTDLKEFGKVAETPPAMELWKTFVKTITSTVKQTLKDIEQYGKDGTWDTGDTAKTMIEASVSVLYSLLSGTIKTITNKTVDLESMCKILSHGNLSSSDDICDKVSQSLEGACEQIGQGLGNTVASNSELRKQFLRGNTLQRIGILMQTSVQQMFGKGAQQ